MRSLSAGRVSLGGRRNSTEPSGKDIERNIADSIAVPASMLRIQEGRSPQADIIHPVMHTSAAIPKERSSWCRIERRFLGEVFWRRLRKDFNLHRLCPDVGGDVLR